MANPRNRKNRTSGKRLSGDLRRRRPLAAYSEEKAARHLLAFAGQAMWEILSRSDMGGCCQEDREALALLVLLLGAMQPPGRSTVSFCGDLLDTLAPLSPSGLARARVRLASTYGVGIEREGEVESWALPLKVRTLLGVFPMGILRSAWNATARDRDRCLAMLALAGTSLDGESTATLSYTDLTAAAGRPISGVLDLERFLMESGTLVWAMPAGDGLTRWRLSSAVVA